MKHSRDSEAEEAPDQGSGWGYRIGSALVVAVAAGVVAYVIEYFFLPRGSRWSEYLFVILFIAGRAALAMDWSRIFPQGRASAGKE